MGREKQLVVWGNCQAEAIADTLRRSATFADFDIPKILGVHQVKAADAPAIHDAIASSDVVLSQPVSAAYRGESLSTEYLRGIMKPGARMFVFPSLHFDGYFPEQIILYDPSAKDPGAGYHDRNIIEGFIKGMKANDLVRRIFSENFYSVADCILAVESAIARLEEKEQECEIRVSSFIRSEYRSRRLFHVVNHPFNALLTEVARQLSALLGRSFALGPEQPEYLDKMYLPIYRSTAKGLRLAFDARQIYRLPGIGRNAVGLREAVDLFYEFYARNPQTLDFYRQRIAQGR